MNIYYFKLIFVTVVYTECMMVLNLKLLSDIVSEIDSIHNAYDFIKCVNYSKVSIKTLKYIYS